MNSSYIIKESKVQEYFNITATVDDYAKVYAYMNCIELRYYNCDANLPAYMVDDTSNDGIKKGAIITWSSIDEYITNILDSGCTDDIECIYNYLYV